MKKIILATDLEFWNEDMGCCKRISQLLCNLVSYSQVYLFFIGDISEASLAKLECYKQEKNGDFEMQVVKPRKTILDRIRRSFVTKPSKLQSFFLAYIQSQFELYCDKVKPDFIFIEYIRLAYLIDNLEQEKHHLIIDTHDVMHLRYQSYLKENWKHWIRIDEEEEKRALKKFDSILAISSKDASTFKQMLPNKKILTVGYAAKVSSGRKCSEQHRVNILYVASSATANQHGIRNFLNNVWKEVYSSTNCSINLLIVGNICDTINKLRKCPGVVFRGFVDDLEEVYSATDLVINPVYIGGGLKIKNVEALSYGLPLITTAKGAEGMEQGIGNSFLIAKDNADMKGSILQLINEPELRDELSENALKFAKRNFSNQQVYSELQELIMR